MFFILLSLFSINTFGQRLIYEFKVGGDISTINMSSGWTVQRYNNIPKPIFRNIKNFQIGFVIKDQVNDKLAIIFEPGYIQKGGEFSYISQKIDSKLVYGYISWPILFKMVMGLQDCWKNGF